MQNQKNSTEAIEPLPPRNDSKPVLLHVCCAVCAAYPVQKLLLEGFTPVLFFYNPNIHPESECRRRLEELQKYCAKKDYKLIVKEDDPSVWYEYIEGFENEPEKGLRCEKCFELRLCETAKYAAGIEIDTISTTLSVSPHKNSKMIFSVLNKIKEKYNINFPEYDYKKENGFLKTLQIADEENFYRQNYCGCHFSSEQLAVRSE